MNDLTHAGTAAGATLSPRLNQWNAFWFTPEAPTNLGICRAMFYALVLCFFADETFAPWASLGRQSAFWAPLWMYQTLHWPLLPGKVLLLLGIVWKIALILSCLGLFTRISAWVSALLGVYLISLTFNYGKVETHTLPLIFILFILALSRSGDGFSLDARRRRRRSLAPVPASGEYRWPIRMVWLLMSIGFFAAALAKLRASGIHWATGQGFSLLIRRHYYDPTPPPARWGLTIANHAWLAHLFAAGSLLTELLFPLALFDRRARRFFPLMALAMQVGIGLAMGIWFTRFLAAYIFWVPWDRMLGMQEKSPAKQLA